MTVTTQRTQTAYEAHRLAKYEYDALMNKHAGRCHACRKNEATVIDHDHNHCGRTRSCGTCVRGVLCNSCNVSLRKDRTVDYFINLAKNADNHEDQLLHTRRALYLKRTANELKQKTIAFMRTNQSKVEKALKILDYTKGGITVESLLNWQRETYA